MRSVGILFLVIIFVGSISGCRWIRLMTPFAPSVDGYAATGVPIENPLMVPVADREFVWNQVVDTLDNYFRIEREERVKLVDGILTEGRIETYAATGSTVFEPWGRDSSPGYERLHATLQSIERRATVLVTPTDGGYLIHVTVNKTQEEVTQPEHASVGKVIRRHDGSLVKKDRPHTGSSAATVGSPQTVGWIPIGRDLTLERRILHELRSRLLEPNGLPVLSKSTFAEPS